MNKLWTALVAATFGLGMSAAVAQNVDSDKAKAQGQDSVMQEKEGAKANQGATSDTDRERTNRHVDQGTARPDAERCSAWMSRVMSPNRARNNRASTTPSPAAITSKTQNL